jgi:hypothetical protein
MDSAKENQHTAISEFTKQEKESNIGICLDLSKVFDLVDHDILLSKMERMGIQGVTLRRFHAYLENRRERIGIRRVTLRMFHAYLENRIGKNGNMRGHTEEVSCIVRKQNGKEWEYEGSH